MGCCSDPTQQLSSPFLPTSALHCFPLTSFKSLSSLFRRCSGIWGSRDPGLRPCPPTPHSLCPLSSTHPVPKLQGLLSPHFLSLAPLFSAPSSAPSSPLSPQPREASPVVPGIRAARELLYLWIGCSSTPSLVLLSCTLRGLQPAQELFLLPSNPASSRLQITATPFLKRPALNLDSEIASLSRVNFNPLLQLSLIPKAHTFTHLPLPLDFP